MFFQKILRSIIIIPLFFWQILFLILPLIILGYQESLDFYGIFSTLGWLLRNRFFTTIIRSFFFSAVTSIFCLLISYIFSYIVTHYDRSIQMFLLLFASVPFLSNFLIHATSWTSLLENNGILHWFVNYCGFSMQKTSFLYNQFASLIVLIYCYLPYSLLSLYISLDKFDRRLLRASTDLGATHLQTFFKIVIPATENAIITSFFLVFIPCSSEFIIPQIIGGDRQMYCGSIFSYIILTPSLFNIAPTVTLFYILLLVTTCWLFLISFKKCIAHLSR